MTMAPAKSRQVLLLIGKAPPHVFFMLSANSSFAKRPSKLQGTNFPSNTPCCRGMDHSFLFGSATRDDHPTQSPPPPAPAPPAHRWKASIGVHSCRRGCTSTSEASERSIPGRPMQRHPWPSQNPPGDPSAWIKDK